GQLYLSTERYEEAEQTFLKILRTEPRNYGALYSLGQIYSKQGLYREAIKKFEETISIKRDFSYAYYDLGSIYADIGKLDLAESQAKILDNLNQGLAENLRAYIYKVRKPEITFVNTFYAFNMQKGPGTLVSSLDSSLSTPSASKDFSIKVYFDKMMDRASVENIFNWSINRATGYTKGGTYNWGLPVPETEVSPGPLPKQVIYNSDEFSAMVIFTLKQNSTGDGTIDPSHLVFKFSGKDAYGNRMNSEADEYIGLSIIV
ncbi:MAG: tetratricopeptide repeat protein, partial [Thermodesulfovibrionales bacterium]